MADEPESRRWRDRAEEYRVFAQACSSADTRAAYWRLVKNCTHMAEQLEGAEHRTRAAKDGIQT